MPPLAVSAIRGALDPSNRPGPGGTLAARISPLPTAPRAGSPSRIPVAARGSGRSNGPSGRGQSGPRPPRKKYVKNERVEVADRAADDFVTIFYSNMDAYTRAEELPKLYRPRSTLIWNGNRIQGQDVIKEFLSKLPPSKHELLTYDCHPVPGTEAGGRKPSLMLTVNGTVIHGKEAIDHPPSRSHTVLDALPRQFAQTFILVPDIPDGMPPEQWPMVSKYIVLSDHMRFTG